MSETVTTDAARIRQIAGAILRCCPEGSPEGNACRHCIKRSDDLLAIADRWEELQAKLDATNKALEEARAEAKRHREWSQSYAATADKLSEQLEEAKKDRQRMDWNDSMDTYVGLEGD